MVMDLSPFTYNYTYITLYIFIITLVKIIKKPARNKVMTNGYHNMHLPLDHNISLGVGQLKQIVYVHNFLESLDFLCPNIL